MSEIIEAIVLGIVQGLTEFLPVSSSGHLEIAKVLMQDDSLAEQSLFTTVLLHFATALSTVVVFRKKIINIIKQIFLKQGQIERKFVWYIIISMIPAVIIGLGFEDLIEEIFNRNLLLVGFMLLITGLLLFLADRKYEENKPLSNSSAFIVGLAQAFAILPGVSRSGATISTGLMMGLTREDAAAFSFLMVIPLILGKIAKDLLDGSFLENMPSASYAICGFLAAFLAGLVACSWMIQLVKKAGLRYFGIYCFIIAAILLIYQFV